MKFRKKHFIFLFLLVSLLFLIYLPNIGKEKGSACIEDKKCFKVEISDSSSERETGLKDHKSLSLDSGMLFVFPEEKVVGFWMKDMKFPLDLIWINKNYEIIGFEKAIQPCTENCDVYSSSEEILYVLEINSGLIEFYNFEIGDRVKV